MASNRTKRSFEYVYDKNFRWGRGGDTFKTPSPPPPTNNFCPYPTPVLRCFLERFLNDPYHSTSSILHCYPLPIQHPFPPKILIIHICIPSFKCRRFYLILALLAAVFIRGWHSFQNTNKEKGNHASIQNDTIFLKPCSVKLSTKV